MPQDLLERVQTLLPTLGLGRLAGRLADLLPPDPPRRTAALEILEILLQDEGNHRSESRIQRRVKESRLPDFPSLESFDFGFQPSMDRAMVLDLATLAWVDRKEDLVVIGQSGVGKSHIGKALCLIGCRQQRRVLYTTCAGLLADLFASLADGSLRERMKRYTAPCLLLVDDLGYDPIEQEQAREAQLLYKVLEARHQKASTIITSNLPADKWADYLGNHYLTVALLDRILYHGSVLTIEGPSYRLAAHRQRQQARAKERKGAAEPAASIDQPS